jgi:hypothetical protein
MCPVKVVNVPSELGNYYSSNADVVISCSMPSLLRDAIGASIPSPDPYSALKKITE